MARKAYARRYAQAVFEIALEKKELERWQADLQKVAAAVSDSTFLAVLENPKIKLEEKSRLLSRILGDISPLALNLVLLLIARASIGMMGEIAGEYQRLLDAYRGIQAADVTTAVPLDDRDKQKLAEKLGSLVGAKVVLKSEVDPGILGGIIARVGGKLLDGSTRSKLIASEERAGRWRKEAVKKINVIPAKDGIQNMHSVILSGAKHPHQGITDSSSSGHKETLRMT